MEHDFPDEDEQPSMVTCNRCGKDGLDWVDVGGHKPRWVLYQGMKQHQCNTAAAPDEFEDLSK